VGKGAAAKRKSPAACGGAMDVKLAATPSRLAHQKASKSKDFGVFIFHSSILT